LLIRVFHLGHFGDQVGTPDDFGVGVSPGEEEVEGVGFGVEDLQQGLDRQQAVGDRVVDLVQDDEVVVARQDLLTREFQAQTRGLLVVFFG